MTLCHVPERGELKIQTSGWEDDNDGYYGHSYLWYLSLPTLPPLWCPWCPSKVGALNDNDNIGVLMKRYCANTIAGYCSNNFGVGYHDDPSNLAVGDSGTGDFNLRYRIEQFFVYPPTTQPPVAPKLPTAPTQPPVLR